MVAKAAVRLHIRVQGIDTEGIVSSLARGTWIAVVTAVPQTILLGRMRAGLCARVAALCLALAPLTGCTGSPTSASGDSATISGTVTGSTVPGGLTVAVVGTGLSTPVETSGHFQIDGVPSGDVQLRFKDAGVDAIARVPNVASDQFVEILVQLNASSALIVNDTRSNGKASLCHRTGNGDYHRIDVSVNAEPAHRAHGDAKVGEPVPGTQRQLFDANCRAAGPKVAIEKSTNGEEADNPPGPSILVGSTVTWRYVVTNTGTVPLAGVAVVDNKGVVVNCGGVTTVAEGQSLTCTGTGVATLGQYSNIGKVTANSASGAVDDSDLSHYLGVPATATPTPTPPPAPSGQLTICHVPPGNVNARHTITIDSSAWPAHQRHCAGATCDYIGSCQ